jgi:hypothetical protein
VRAEIVKRAVNGNPFRLAVLAMPNAEDLDDRNAATSSMPMQSIMIYRLKKMELRVFWPEIKLTACELHSFRMTV